MAIAGAGRRAPASLAAIIGMADAINHAVPSAAELEGALNRLLAAGLITQRDFGFRLASAGAGTLARIGRPHRAYLSLWDDLNRLFACPCCGPKIKSVRRRVTVSGAAWKHACDEYRSWVEPKRLGQQS